MGRVPRRSRNSEVIAVDGGSIVKNSMDSRVPFLVVMCPSLPICHEGDIHHGLRLRLLSNSQATARCVRSCWEHLDSTETHLDIFHFLQVTLEAINLVRLKRITLAPKTAPINSQGGCFNAMLLRLALRSERYRFNRSAVSLAVYDAG